jgi:GNAT superfamily N-acetyltransferase
MQLVPMQPEEFERFRENHLKAQVPDLARSFDLSMEEARALSSEQLGKMLPEGHASPGHYFFTILDENKVPAGHLWFFVRDFYGRKRVFVADILVYKGFRGRGIGRFSLGWLAAWAKEHKYEGLALHVFGSNAGARRLYEAIGFQPTSINMVKKI